jgi:hypothetical protein
MAPSTFFDNGFFYSSGTWYCMWKRTD